jgi:hypothetical protein
MKLRTYKYLVARNSREMFARRHAVAEAGLPKTLRLQNTILYPSSTIQTNGCTILYDP